MGALSGVIGDTADAYRMRILNIAVPQLFGALGIMLGTLVYGTGWAAVAALTLVGLVSGMMSTIGAVASVSGLLLLLNAVVGAGLPMPQPWWVAPLLLTVGGLFVLALTLLAWPLRRKLPERVAVAGTYLAVADLLAAAGSDAYEEQRHTVTQSLNTSYDLILARRARYHGRSNAMVRLLAQLNVVIPLVEAAPAVHVQPAHPPGRDPGGGTRTGRRRRGEPHRRPRTHPARTGLARHPGGGQRPAARGGRRAQGRPRPVQRRRPARPSPPPSGYGSGGPPATYCSPGPRGGTGCGWPSASGWRRR